MPWAENRFWVSITRNANGVSLPVAERTARYSLRIAKLACIELSKIGLRVLVIVMQNT